MDLGKLREALRSDRPLTREEREELDDLITIVAREQLAELKARRFLDEIGGNMDLITDENRRRYGF